MIVYADLFFLTNGAIDFLLLWATGRLLAARIVRWRLLVASLLGAAYATAFLFPAARPLYSVGAKVAFSFLMVAVAFPSRSVKELGTRWGCFVILSLASGGGALAMAYLRLPGVGGPFPGVPAWLVGLAVAVTLALAARAWSYRRRHAGLCIVLTEVALGGRKVAMPALVDTGNQLRDPFSGVPVLVAEYGVVARLLPRALRDLVSGAVVGGDTAAGAAYMRLSRTGAGVPFGERLRLIPFTSLGTDSGLIYGFRPDGVRVKEGTRWQEVAPVVVGVCPGPLSLEGWYQALFPHAALPVSPAGER